MEGTTIRRIYFLINLFHKIDEAHIHIIINTYLFHFRGMPSILPHNGPNGLSKRYDAFIYSNNM